MQKTYENEAGKLVEVTRNPIDVEGSVKKIADITARRVRENTRFDAEIAVEQKIIDKAKELNVPVSNSNEVAGNIN